MARVELGRIGEVRRGVVEAGRGEERRCGLGGGEEVVGEDFGAECEAVEGGGHW